MPRPRMRVWLVAALVSWGLPVGASSAGDPCRSLPDDAWVDLSRLESRGGVGGTGRHEPRGGVGGTGLIEPQGGVGGTGREEHQGGVGGTGIFGTVTGFGSICVNGERVHYDEDAPVERWGREAATDDLALGQLVWVTADQDAEGALRAREIEILAAVSGPLEAVDLEASVLTVAGRSVSLGDEAGLRDAATGETVEMASLEVGTPVAVSGLDTDEGVLVASRVAVGQGARDAVQAPPLAQLIERSGAEVVSVEGVVGAGAPDGSVRVGGLTVHVPEGAPALRPNDRVWLRARVGAGKALRPDRIHVRPVPVRPRRPLEQAQRPVRVEKAARVQVERPRIERVRRPARAERPNRPERPERPAAIERPAAVERPTRPSVVRVDRPPNVRPVDRPDRIPTALQRVKPRVKPERPHPRPNRGEPRRR